jgi:large subunit ribosomal protein L31
MKKNIHPESYRELVVVLSNGETFNTKSCYNKSNTLKLDVDPLNHPAWKEKNTNFINTKNDRVNKFEKKFGSGIFDYKESSKVQ